MPNNSIGIGAGSSSPESRRSHYRNTLLHDLLMEISGQEEAGAILECIAARLCSFMDVHYAWLLTVEGDYFKTYTYPAGQTMMGKEAIALLLSGEMHAAIPNLAAFRGTLPPARARGMEYFPDDVQSLMALPAQRGRRTDGFLVIASRRAEAYTKEHEDFFFEFMLILRPVFRMLRLQHGKVPEGVDTSRGTDAPRINENLISEFFPDAVTNVASVAHHGGNFINESPVDATAAADARADASAQAQTPAHSPKQPPSAQHESDDLRRALTDMLIHDLRAPLGIINWNMEQLLDGVSASAALNAEQERFVKASIESTQELLEMADSLLDIDRLENGVLALNPEDCSLEQLAKTIAGRMDFMTQQMALRFSFSFPEGYSAIRADRQLMRRVLFNLLFNASKYAPEKSTIYIEGGSDHEKIWLSVEDEGQGIPEKYLESIFDKYVQAEARSVHGNIRGKGLGLTFCRLAVEAHGGSIRALNARGARFIVELPRSLP